MTDEPLPLDLARWREMLSAFQAQQKIADRHGWRFTYIAKDLEDARRIREIYGRQARIHFSTSHPDDPRPRYSEIVGRK